MRSCSVSGCKSKDRKNFQFPNIYSPTETFKKISKQRQLAWLAALRKTDADPQSFCKIRVCANHFISGKCASILDINNVDWVPNLNLRHPSSSTEIIRCSIDGCTISNEGHKCNFYRIPKTNERGELKEMSENIASKWISTTHDKAYVCQSHYISEISGKLRNPSNDESISSDSDPTESVKSFRAVIAKIEVKDGLKSSNKPLPTVKKAIKSFKSGEIYRDENGRYSFNCSYCKAVTEDGGVMIDHIDTHFESNNKHGEFDEPSPEFVNFPSFQPESNESIRELTNTILTSRRSAITTLDKSKFQRANKRIIDHSQTNDTVSTPFKRICIQAATTNAKEIQNKLKELKLKSPVVPVKLYESKDLRPTVSLQNVQNKEKKVKSVNVNVTSSKDLVKNVYQYPNPDLFKCCHCMSKPAVSESDPRPHKCIACGEWFENHIVYRTHFSTAHNEVRVNIQHMRCYQCEMEPALTNELDPRRHKCVLCKEWLPNHLEFKTHVRDVHNNDVNTFFGPQCAEYTCYVCDKSVTRRESLVYHIKGHFDKFLDYQCHTCGSRFRMECKLKTHMKTHENNPTGCDVCNKVFPNYVRMRTHRLCHNTEMKHFCAVCSKGFKLSKYLRTHMNLHKDEKVPCRFCEATFSFTNNRRTHEKTVHNVV